MNPREKARERILVLRCQAGDEDAFAQLFRRYQGPLKYYLRRLLDSPETADDALQNAWLKALRGLKGLRDTGAFRSWLYRIARNEALQHLRRDGRQAALREDIELAAPQIEDEDSGFTPADAARIHAGLAQLSPAHREVLTLRFLEEMPYEEIASVVGCGLNTVRSRIHYAKRALRTILEETYHE